METSTGWAGLAVGLAALLVKRPLEAVPVLGEHPASLVAEAVLRDFPMLTRPSSGEVVQQRVAQVAARLLEPVRGAVQAPLTLQELESREVADPENL